METFHEESSDYRENRLAHWQVIHQQALRSLGDYYLGRLQVHYPNLIPVNASGLEYGFDPDSHLTPHHL